jgi:hypothetical protein
MAGAVPRGSARGLILFVLLLQLEFGVREIWMLRAKIQLNLPISPFSI